MSLAQAASVEISSLSGKPLTNPMLHSKRKRKETWDSDTATHARSKRLKGKKDSSGNSYRKEVELVEGFQRATSIEPLDRGKNGDEALGSKMTKPSVPDVKLAKRERRKTKREQGPQSKATQNQKGTADRKNVEHRVEARLEEPTSRGHIQHSWKVSEPIGGSFVDREVLFSVDEKYIILAKEYHVEIYSTSTSTLVRSLAVGYNSSISGYSFSTKDSNILYVSTFSGSIYKWDWVQGKRLARWDVSSHITYLATAPSDTADMAEDIVYVVDKTAKKGRWMITAHKLIVGNQAAKSELITLYKSQQPISSIQVMEGGRCLVASSGKRIIIGLRDDSNRTSLASTTFTWREVVVLEFITCFDVRVDSKPAQPVMHQSEKSRTRKAFQSLSIDIVIGNVKGEIYVYKDLLDRLIQKERPDKTGKVEGLAASLLHWHREPVSTVKWSLDGNYIISGGGETVLVLWQLDTGARQYLPHLSSAIESLVVSPRGSSYALRLSDNSAMVLSTSELRPTASIAGIQCRSVNGSNLQHRHRVKVDSVTVGNEIPVALSALSPTQLMLAVPASQATSSEPVRESRAVFLQTFDLATGRHVSRQALARNNTTVVNIGGNGEKIGEPTVRYMLVSHNSQWLATVDEWNPPSKDVDFLLADGTNCQDEQQLRREVFLKFWLWNRETIEWQLVTRVDNPHASTSGFGVGQVLAFAESSTALEFATCGEDGVIRIWSPKSRRRNGVEVRGKDAEGLVTWHCHHTTQLVNPGQQTALLSVSSRSSIAYSEDGSLLAVSFQCSSADQSNVVHFLDAMSGQIQQSRAGLYAGGLIDMGIVDRYLIILSDHLCVWDMVDDEIHFGLSLQSDQFSSEERLAATHLAVDQRHRTFALSLPVPGKEKSRWGPLSTENLSSQVAVFDPSIPTPLHTTSLPHMVMSLRPVPGSKGYIALDSAAEVRILSPESAPIAMKAGVSFNYPQPAIGLEGIYGNDAMVIDSLAHDGKRFSGHKSEMITPQPTSAVLKLEAYDDDAPVVRQQEIAGIFDTGSAFALPPVEQLFERVVELFTKRLYGSL